MSPKPVLATCCERDFLRHKHVYKTELPLPLPNGLRVDRRSPSAAVEEVSKITLPLCERLDVPSPHPKEATAACRLCEHLLGRPACPEDPTVQDARALGKP